MSTSDKLVSEAWNALRHECCVNPETAIRCVLVSEEAFRAAMAKVLQDRRWLLSRLAFDPRDGDSNA